MRMLDKQSARSRKPHETSFERRMIGWTCSMHSNMGRANRVLVFNERGKKKEATSGEADLFLRCEDNIKMNLKMNWV
jgi:ribosomal protein L1